MCSCPSTATLARLGLDSMQDETLSTLEGHIACCNDCQAELNRLVRNDAAGPPQSSSLPDRDDPLKLPGFAIDRELGRGSMSVVYLARQPSLGRLVALKVVRSGPAAGSREYARWLREGRSFSLLRHDNVVRLHDVGEAGGWLYLVLEYVPGGTLNDRLDIPYAAPDAARLLVAIALAVEAIHRAGLLHLDLKPSNILMDAAPGAPRERAIPRVGDFGLASLRDDPDDASQTIGPIGTPRYMAPEQVGADRERLGPAADVYGLGALLYHVVTGRPPFAAPSVAETLDQVRGQEPVPPRRLNPAIPRDLETICLKCLRKDPGQRYASAQAVADDLRRFLDGVAIAARPASPAEKTWRWCRRRPAVAALAVALALAIGGGFLGMFLLWQRAEAEAGRAAELLGQLIELNAGGAGNLPRVLSPDRKISQLRLARRNLLELADRLPDRQALYSQLMSVDQRLGETLREESRGDEVRVLYDRSLRDAEEAIRQFPDAAFPQSWLFNVLHRLAEIAEADGRMEDHEALHARALAASEERYRSAPDADRLAELTMRRHSLARALTLRGRRDDARAQLLANRRDLEDAPPDWLNEGIVAARALNLLVFRDLGIEPPPGTRSDPDAPLATAAGLGSDADDRLPAEAWARSAARALRFDDPGRPATYRESRAAVLFTTWIKTSASDHRKRGRLDQARRNVERLAAFARLVVERNPDDPTGLLVLADSCEQAGKNAWRVDDRATVRIALRRAIEANRRALDLAPYDELARHELERRERKLDALRLPR
jgi:tetratricopeptide (TPR) repeat protein